MTKEILAIIPARGGSKGIPDKNIMPLGNQPLICWTIYSALNSELITRVVVSTDDDVIAEISKNAGAEVVRRPDELSGDEANSESALLYTLGFLDANSYKPDLIVFLQCTSPFRQNGVLDEAIQTLYDYEADSLVSLSPYTARTFLLDKDKTAIPTNHHIKVRPRRQDQKIQYRENGSFYLVKPEILIATHCRLGGKIIGFEVDQLYAIEIDNEQDWFIANCVADVMVKHWNAEDLYGLPNDVIH